MYLALDLDDRRLGEIEHLLEGRGEINFMSLGVFSRPCLKRDPSLFDVDSRAGGDDSYEDE